jgi:hypothetical protein
VRRWLLREATVRVRSKLLAPNLHHELIQSFLTPHHHPGATTANDSSLARPIPVGPKFGTRWYYPPEWRWLRKRIGYLAIGSCRMHTNFPSIGRTEERSSYSTTALRGAGLKRFIHDLSKQDLGDSLPSPELGSIARHDADDARHERRKR